MGIEEDIKSTNFEDNYHKAVINLNYTYGWINNYMRPEFERYKLTQQQFNILRILRGQYPKPATVNLLKDRMIDKMSDASRIVDRLVQKGLVSRCTNSRDRRAVDIRISDEGLEILKKMDASFKIKDLFKQNLSEEEAGQLSDLLDKMRG
ncbi:MULTISPECIES: MarR family transcriptional regulator [unclassified Mucilaginibacter]|uniref:MarR family winged helix-turn-helix transcriptional regulator n=1 Tax=unclassified Mucilaginibacter TaxID=2617802 RepID=UPI002AC8D0D3|nr:MULTISPECIES: MarR family transcriptional regulator [unclassified Mucilaginibacter]MEB0263653.1 MarR family transcriptional regulator [Mucilaginibacter sp. 10I4]MEB0277887.1 MarR family transcriptional regulator [Mucilaginibacter sp. 10B2]MEB0300566.1 MarR family transcriptional regulator [Mucilaginibacter sp. 5C4]WPX22778.1 MarR family transcriptional regulator [Mucilaginibacter sp. 5C4]